MTPMLKSLSLCLQRNSNGGILILKGCLEENSGKLP